MLVFRGGRSCNNWNMRHPTGEESSYTLPIGSLRSSTKLMPVFSPPQKKHRFWWIHSQIFTWWYIYIYLHIYYFKYVYTIKVYIDSKSKFYTKVKLAMDHWRAKGWVFSLEKPRHFFWKWWCFLFPVWFSRRVLWYFNGTSIFNMLFFGNDTYS